MQTPLPVQGYTPQTNAHVDLVNENKIIEEMVMRQVDKHVRQYDSIAIDQRMVALARTNLQTAFMFLNRAVFRPTRITGELDISFAKDIT